MRYFSEILASHCTLASKLKRHLESNHQYMTDKTSQIFSQKVERIKMRKRDFFLKDINIKQCFFGIKQGRT